MVRDNRTVDWRLNGVRVVHASLEGSDPLRVVEGLGQLGGSDPSGASGSSTRPRPTLDIPAVEENPDEIHWVDDIHKAP